MRSTPRCWRKPAAARRPAQGRAVGPEGRRRARQHLCVRGAAPRAAVAQALGLDPRDRSGVPNARAEGSSRRSRRCSATRSRPAARRCATIAAPTASSATSSTISASTTARESPARRPAARAPSSASCRAGARRSSARCVRSKESARGAGLPGEHLGHANGRPAPRSGAGRAYAAVIDGSCLDGRAADAVVGACIRRRGRDAVASDQGGDLASAAVTSGGPCSDRRATRSTMSYQNIMVETQGPGRHHPAQPAAGAQRAQRRADRRARARGRRRSMPIADIGCMLHHRLRQGVRGRRRHQGDGGQVLHRRVHAAISPPTGTRSRVRASR